MMEIGRHPSRKHSVLGKSPPRELEVVNSMDYEQASIDSFDSAARAVAEMLTVSDELYNVLCTYFNVPLNIIIIIIIENFVIIETWTTG